MPILPAGWVALLLKHVCTVRDCKHVTAEFVDEGFPVASIREVQSRYVDLAAAKQTNATYYAQLVEGGRRPRTGDLLFSRNATVGEVAQVPSDSAPFAMGQDVCLLRPMLHKLDSAYAWYVLRSELVQTQIALALIGSTFKRVNVEEIRNLSISLPPLEQQQQIVDFLDRETDKIDSLIAKQEQLITTLHEDRTATISQAVTKGLDPNVETKDSGVEWFGAIPVHWSAPQIGLHAAVGNGSTPSRENVTYWSGGSVPWLNSSHVNRKEITDADQFVTELALRECHLPQVSPGSVLVGLTGQGKTRGMASILMTPATINQHLAYVTPTDANVDNQFLLRILESAYQLLRDISDENGSTKGGLTCAALRKVRIPLPPANEQREIVVFLKRRCDQVDLLIAKALEVVQILREYRSALITCAVTGKIDLRGAT